MFTLATRGDADIPADLSLLMLPERAEDPGGRAARGGASWCATRSPTWSGASRRPCPPPDGERPVGSTGGARDPAPSTSGWSGGQPDSGAPTPGRSVNDATIRYEVMSRVAENWIPFIPVHVAGSTREIQLRRAVDARASSTATRTRRAQIRPRTTLLRQGLEDDPPAGYDVHEEEVPRSGVRVTQSFQRTRWYGGEVFVWLGVRKQTGRGERSSGLAFDRYRPV